MSQSKDVPFVRPATVQDLPEIARIFLDGLDTSLPGVTFSTLPNYNPFERFVERLQGRLLPDAPGVATTFVAVLPSSSEVLGYVCVKEKTDFGPDFESFQARSKEAGLSVPEPGPEVDMIFVKVEGGKGGKGVGSILMRHVQEVEAWRKSGLWVECFGRNEAAVKFYKKWNFELVTSLPHVVEGKEEQVWLQYWSGGKGDS